MPRAGADGRIVASSFFVGGRLGCRGERDSPLRRRCWSWLPSRSEAAGRPSSTRSTWTGRDASVTTRRHPRRLAVVVAVVAAAGTAAFAAALASLAGSHLGAGAGVGLFLFVAAMMLADRFPVPLEGVDAAGISLSFVFGVAAVVLFGWAGGLVAVVAAPAVGGLLDRRPPPRVAYNNPVHALAAG